MNAPDEVVVSTDIDVGIDVFISYASADDLLDVLHAHQLAGWLDSEGYAVWWDLHIQAGYAQKQLEAQVKRARRVIVLWSPRAADSHNVFNECQPAVNAEKLLPVIVEGDHKILPRGWDGLVCVELADFERQKPEILRKLGIGPSRKHAAPAVADNARISLSGLPSAASRFIGREAELALLARAWASTAPGGDSRAKTNAIVFHAIGGAGKSALLRQFLDTLADEGYHGAAKVYGWSAYSQGSGDNRAASADEFISKALAFFGHDLARQPIPDAVERSRRLAHLVGQGRSLLALDGLEPLQDAPHVNGGRLKDRGLAALIAGLAELNAGLLVITTRQELPELASGHAPRLISQPLDRLNKNDGVGLLTALGVRGKRTELERAVEDTLGHALSINLLGAYLSAAHGGDVNQREQFRLGEIEEADPDLTGDATARYARRAARIMEGALGRLREAETAILHIAGLFDRPAEREALDALLAEPAIAGLTEAFHGLPLGQRKTRWNVAAERLRRLKLIVGEDRHQPGALDAHPIVRAHFGDRLKRLVPEAYREAHSRLYDFYRYQGLPQEFCNPLAYASLAIVASFPDNREVNRRALEAGRELYGAIPATLRAASLEDRKDAAKFINTSAFETALTKFLPHGVESMRPCFAAIAHGCAARRHEEVFDEVYFPRVQHGNEEFLRNRLGAPNADLAALAPFFDALWRDPAIELRKSTKSRVLNYAALALWAEGRLREAIEPMEVVLEMDTDAHDWKAAAANASNISDLRLALGDVSTAILAARNSVRHADASGNAFCRMASRTVHANALHESGKARDALVVFAEAEAMQAERQPALPKLTSLQGYQYCDLLLAAGQQQEAIGRASYALKVAEANSWLLDIALDRLTLGRAHAALCLQTAGAGDVAEAQNHLDAAVDGLRRAGTEHHLPRGLLARAAFRRNRGDFIAAAVDLTEALDIASRGDMRLHLADYHLEAARLALAQHAVTADAALRAEAEARHADAARLIAAAGYKRRDSELAAIHACLDGLMPASLLGPDRDAQGRPIWRDLDPPDEAAKPAKRPGLLARLFGGNG
jgi:tetratricopeptide (TPR) repeat protein